jgi:flagellar basal body rod protein FlgG
MDSLLISAASGMRARLESLEILANNLANQNSAGFKADREAYALYVAPEALEDSDSLPQPPVVPTVERHWTDHAQGALRETGNPLDLALEGRGFLTVRGPSGPLYTRNGALRLSPSGTLETTDGYAVLAEGGGTFQARPGEVLAVSPTGEARIGGAPAGRLALVAFARPRDLPKREGTYFAPADGAAPEPFAGSVRQGMLERANGSPAESAVRLVSILREFEMLQKAILIDSEMGKRSDELARVSG